jgi:hypothetical protein
MRRLLLLLVFCCASWLAAAQATLPMASADLARLWDAEHVSSPVAALVDHDELMRHMDALRVDTSGQLHIREIGKSLEGREIYDVSFGTGPYVVLLWSQMHGDEPIATSALFDIYEFVRRHHADPQVKQLLGALTVHTVPMLNPDGAERFQRRTAQGIDMNRDALLLQSPESVLLKKLRDELQPRVGFNLHNESWKTTSGRPPVPAAISLLSVAYDDANSVDERRVLTKKLGGVVRDALEPLAPGRIAKYDDAFEVRAFGDNLTKWGTPVLLIESGPWPDARPDPPLIRLNYVAIIRALLGLADGSVARADPDRYDSLAKNAQLGFYIKVTNVTIVNNNGLPPFIGDVGIDVARRVRFENGQRRYFQNLTVNDVGDLRTYAGVFVIDGTGMTILPADPTWKEGAPVTSETPLQWAADIRAKRPVTLPWQAGQLLPMQPAELALIRLTGDAIEVQRVFHAVEEIR